MRVTLADVPEELLERILALVLVQSTEASPRPSWHLYQTPPPTAPTVISPLLVCHTWLRIATPIHYRHPVLRTPRHVELLLRALRHTPSLAPCVRSLHLQATSPALRQLVPLCKNLDTLDVTVDNADGPQPAVTTGIIPAQEGERERSVVVEFCEAFGKARGIRHLVVRKNAYLTQPNAIYIFEQLAKAIARWHRLETVNIAFKLSHSPAATALVKALVAAPRLHTLHTQLPAVWNTILLDIAQNPALSRIVLSPAHEQGAHLFLAEAKRHPRLMDLIRAGTPPPSPYPAYAGLVMANSRARAASSAVAIAGKTPMPVATWAYERDVPPPACPPARRAGQHGHMVAAPGSVVGPSTYVSGPSGSAALYSGHLHHHMQAHPHQYVAAQPQYLTPNHPGQYYAHGVNQAAPSRPHAHMQGPQPPVVGGQTPRRYAGGRRMTAA